MKGLKLLASLLGGEPDISLWSWATVTDDSPLRVKLDGEASALPITPDTLVTGLAVNDRVWVQLVTNTSPARQYRRVLVLGRAGGTPFDIDNVYPVGAIYMSTSSTSPATLFGGTWSALQDSFLVGAGNLYAVNSTGGEATHVLTVAEMPSHTHTTRNYAGTDLAGSGAGARFAASTSGASSALASGSDQSNNTGGGDAHNNLPPYTAVYMWKRTA